MKTQNYDKALQIFNREVYPERQRRATHFRRAVATHEKQPPKKKQRRGKGVVHGSVVQYLSKHELQGLLPPTWVATTDRQEKRWRAHSAMFFQVLLSKSWFCRGSSSAAGYELAWEVHAKQWGDPMPENQLSAAAWWSPSSLSWSSYFIRTSLKNNSILIWSADNDKFLFYV